MNQAVREHFAEQARICAEYGSPFTSELIAKLGDDIAAGGPAAALVNGWLGDPRVDALALRCAGALHAAVLTDRDVALSAQYPAQRSDWRMADVWPAARAYLAREADWVRDFLRLPPQTNEVRRSIALAAAFLHFAQGWRGPIDTLELGASAGLNVNWDRFQFRTGSWRWGNAQSPVTVDTEWRGPPPPLPPVHVRRREACDLNPLDVRDPAQFLRLKAYIWADQSERLARFAAAAAMARDVRVERAEADAWLAQKLAARSMDAATVVCHSVFLQYPPQAAREAIIAKMESAGAKATPDAPLAWIRLEPGEIFGGARGLGAMVLDLTTWPEGERRVIATTDGHVRSVDAL